MRWQPLESSWAKFHRAGTHLDALEHEFRRAIGEPHETFAVEREIKDRHVVIRITHIPQFRDAGMLLGDAVGNYRAALDHLVWDLVQLGSKPKLGREEATKVQFPMARSFASFAAQRQQRAPGVGDEQWAIIREYQPYKRGHRGHAMLWLRRLSDTDKHRYVVPAATALAGFTGKVRLYRCQIVRERRFTPGRALYVGCPLWEFDVVPTGEHFDVQVESEITIQPSLGYGIALMPTLILIRAAVLDVLARFEERL
jgi:hypothetical protein